LTTICVILICEFVNLSNNLRISGSNNVGNSTNIKDFIYDQLPQCPDGIKTEHFLIWEHMEDLAISIGYILTNC
jgi:hypothetical protein